MAKMYNWSTMEWWKTRLFREPVKLDFEEITLALDILNQEIEGAWRLPNRKELESLVCKNCDGAKIDSVYSLKLQHNLFGHLNEIGGHQIFWSVNFFTGHSYGRFVPEKKLFVRFVRDR